MIAPRAASCQYSETFISVMPFEMHPQKNHAEQRAADTALAAKETCAADGRRGDNVKLHAGRRGADARADL